MVCVGLYSFPAFAQPYGIGSVEDDLVNDFTQRRYNQPTELFLCLCKQNRPTLQRALSNALILISSNGGGVVGGGGVGWCGDDVVVAAAVAYIVFCHPLVMAGQACHGLSDLTLIL